MMRRTAEIKRKTSETDIVVIIDIDSAEISQIDTGVPFFDHMLSSMSRHGRFYLNVKCQGDTVIDDHHSVEDTGICIGRAIKEALGDKAGIKRFGHAVIPMDEALTLSAVDLSGRAYFKYTGKDLKGTIKKYNEELTPEFLRSLAMGAEMNLHIEQKYGDNRHHIHESIFKALGVSLYQAFMIDEKLQGEILSTKGTIV